MQKVGAPCRHASKPGRVSEEDAHDRYVTEAVRRERVFVPRRVSGTDAHLLSKCFEAARCLHRLQPPDARTPCAPPTHRLGKRQPPASR